MGYAIECDGCLYPEPPPLDIQGRLYDFHSRLGEKPGDGGVELRAALHREEHEELMEALLAMIFFDRSIAAHEPAATEARKALARELADVVYIAYGTAFAFDIDLDAALREIHRAAMSKIVRPNGEPPVFRADGKVLKPPEFVPPDMTKAVTS